MRQMNLFLIVAGVMISLAPAAGTVLAADAAPTVTPAAIDKAVAALAGYDLGKPHEPIIEVERLIRATAGQADQRRRLEQRLVKMLDSPCSEECKYFLCRQLWRIGTDESVPVLRKMLLDDATVHIACYGLRNGANPKAVAALREALPQAKGKALVTILGVLGDWRDEACREAIGNLAFSDDPAVAEAALAALGKISGPDAAAVLAKARATGAEKLRTVAAQASLQCAEGLLAKGKDKDAASIYQELLAKGDPAVIRRGALVGLLAMGGPEAVTLALSTLGSNDPMMQATAIANLRTLKGQGVSERFAAELPKQPAAAQVLLIGALADRPDAAARPAIAAAARSENAEVRTAAIKALGKVGDASCVDLLVQAVAEGKTDEEKRAALLSLLLLRGEGIDGAITAGLKTAPAEARAQLILVLHDRGAASAVPALLKEAAHADPGVRRAAFKALERLAEPKDLPAVIELLVGLPGDDGREEAERAVVLVSRKTADEAGRADAALAALRTAGPAAKGSLLRVLRGIANVKSFEALQAALKENDPKIQDAAIRALADWPDARATAALLDIFRGTPNETHRVVALRGCVRLLGLAGGHTTPETLKAYGDLMKQARRPEEKKLVLAGLATVNDPAALAMVEPCLADAAVSAEASLAALALARAIAGAHHPEAKAALAKLAAATKDPGVRQQAEALLRNIDKAGDCITAWQISGPYAEKGKTYTQLFDVAFPPEKPQAKDAAWRPLPASEEAKDPRIVDLAGPLEGGVNCVAYVRTWVQSDKAQDARLEVGADDGVKVWLNGKVVVAKNRGGACVPGEEKANVNLQPGWNLLLVKITQASGPWEFCIRLCRRDGSRLEGVRVDASRN